MIFAKSHYFIVASLSLIRIFLFGIGFLFLEILYMIEYKGRKYCVHKIDWPVDRVVRRRLDKYGELGKAAHRIYMYFQSSPPY